MIAVTMFLAGSILSGTAQSMTQLIVFRALQGLGAGGLLPLAFTIIGDIFTMEQRAKMQGLFSGVWGISSLLGPLAGGWLVDNVSWRAVFYVNLPFGLLAAAIIWFGLLESHMPSVQKRSIDYVGVILLVSGIVAFLLALLEGPDQGWTAPLVLALALASLVLLVAFVWHEMRDPEPIISPALFQQRLFSVASLHGFLTGMAMFGSISFIPLFGQGVLGGRLLLRAGYRRIVIVSMFIMVVGTFLMSRINGATTEWQVWLYGILMGMGMGGGVTAFLISVQSEVTRQQLGAATSTLQFMRNVGGTVGVSIFGTVMVTSLIDGLARQGSTVNIDPRVLLDPSSSVPPAVLASMRGALGDAIGAVFTLALVGVVAALAIVFFSPRPVTRDSTVPPEGQSEVLAGLGTD
jgi:MFS family permease